MKTYCPDCASELAHFRRGGCLIVRCESNRCRWEAATSFPIPIFQDAVRYTLRIPALPAPAPETLVALNQRFPHGIAVTRKLARLGELPPFQGSALDIWQEASKLRSAGIPFHIEPHYPFDIGTPTSAFGPPDGRLPDSALDDLLG